LTKNAVSSNKTTIVFTGTTIPYIEATILSFTNATSVSRFSSNTKAVN
jgi:hypothetical protein